MSEDMYAISKADEEKCTKLFEQYDKDGSGYVEGSEAVDLFTRSGMDIQSLKKIWALADKDNSNRLNKGEFIVAMYLIICATKRSLPIPSTLPSCLEFLITEEESDSHDDPFNLIPVDLPVLNAPSLSYSVAPPEEQKNNLVQQPLNNSFQQVEDPIPTQTPPPSSSTSTLGIVDNSEVVEMTEGISNTANKISKVARSSVGLSEALSHQTLEATSTIRDFLQSLRAEQISLEASLSNTQQDYEESQRELQQARDKLSEVKGHLQAIRKRRDELKGETYNIRAETTTTERERVLLMREIEEIMAENQNLENEKSQLGDDMQKHSNVLAHMAGQMEGNNLMIDSLNSQQEESSGEIKLLKVL